MENLFLWLDRYSQKTRVETRYTGRENFDSMKVAAGRGDCDSVRDAAGREDCGKRRNIIRRNIIDFC